MSYQCRNENGFVSEDSAAFCIFACLVENETVTGNLLHPSQHVVPFRPVMTYVAVPLLSLLAFSSAISILIIIFLPFIPALGLSCCFIFIGPIAASC